MERVPVRAHSPAPLAAPSTQAAKDVRPMKAVAADAVRGTLSRDASLTDFSAHFDHSLLAAEAAKTSKQQKLQTPALSVKQPGSDLKAGLTYEIAAPNQPNRHDQTSSNNSLRSYAIISPLELLSLLSSPGAPNVLLLDMRPQDLFSAQHIQRSACISIPSLILKRIKRGTLANFQIENFVTGKSKALHSSWASNVNETGSSFTIVVCDDNVSSIGEENDGRLLAQAILSSQFLKSKPEMKVLYLQDGYDAFEQLGIDKIGKVVESSQTAPTPNSSLMVSPNATTLVSPLLNSPMLAAINTKSKVTAEPVSSPFETSVPSATSTYGTPSLTFEAASPMSATFVTPVSAQSATSSSPSLSSTTQAKPTKRPSFGIVVTPRSEGLPDSVTPTGPAASPNKESNDRALCQITPSLFLSSEHAPTAEDAPAILVAAGITHVLNMAREVQDHREIVARAADGRFKWIQIDDTPDQEFDTALRDAVAFVESAMARGGVVLVHCRAGRSRSAAAVIGVLVKTQRLPVKDAYQLVKEKRGGLAVNVGFLAALSVFEAEVLGCRSVIDELQTNQPSTN
ncbi:Dual specificity protein phosphatase 2 [Entophlyctis luteolus]|nr:Dual specificity protein phosphatase 2 [Entophlyctis luteolus]